MSDFTFDSLELHDISVHGDDSIGRVVLDLVGGFHGGLVVRGADLIAPGRVGRIPQDRIEDSRLINAHGYVLGTSNEDYLALMDALEAVFVPLYEAALVVTGPYKGLGAGVTRTINARFTDFRAVAPRPELSGLVAEMDVQWEAVDSPYWTEAPS